MRAETEEVIVPLGNEFKSIFETVFQNFIGTYIVATWSDPPFFFFSFLSRQRNRTEKASAVQNFYFKN